MRKRISLISTILLTTVSCADYDATETLTPGGDPLDVRAEVQQQYVTRANDGGFADGDQIGVFIVNYTTSDSPEGGGKGPTLQPTGNHADNVRFTYSEATGKWTGSYQLYWKDKVTPIDAYGYYPFDAELSSTQAYPFTVQKNQRDNLPAFGGAGGGSGRQLSGYEASDFLWAKQEKVVPTAGLINLKHHHLMAGIKVVLTEGEGFLEGEWDDIDKSVLVESTVLDATINLQAGSVCCVSNATNGVIIPQQQGNVWRAVVVPQTVATGKPLITITVDNKTYRFTRPEAMTYIPGKLHQFTFDVQKSLETGDYQFTLFSESVTPWDNDLESHNGTAREYVTVHVEEGQFLGDVIEQMGIAPASIVNLKLTGVLTGRDTWLEGDMADENFRYISDNMSNLEAINMKDLRTKSMRSFQGYWDGSWTFDDRGDPLCDAFGHPIHADDYIPANSFHGLSTLAYVVWPDSLKGIGDRAFCNAGLRGSLILPEGLKHIGGETFRGQSLLTGDLYIPSTVEFIGGGAFYECNFTNELILPEHMVYLGPAAFWSCKYLTGTIRIPDGLGEVNNSWEYSSIGGPVIVPQGVKKYNPILSPITSLRLPEGLEEIGGVWNDWRTDGPNGSYRVKLTKVNIPSTVRKIGENAFANTGVQHITLPEGLEILESGIFANTYLQDTLVIPSTVKQIRHHAFGGCRMLNAVILPAGLEGIQGEAFGGCYSLDYIQCLGSTPPVIEDNSFSGVEKNNFTVVVPEGAVEAYKNTDGWREFKRISTYRNFVCRPMKAKLLNKSNVRDIVLNADEAWTVKECPSWIHLNKTSGYKKTELKASIDAMAHGAGDREGSVVFQLNRNDENGKPITCTFQVQQFDYEIDEDAIVTLQTATKGQRGGIDILFVGDGYDAEDIARGTYRTDMEQEMEYFFGVEPYKTYRNYFNVHAAMAMSYESGALDSPDKWRNTKFDITYGGSDNGRLSVDFDQIADYVLSDVTSCPVTNANFNRSLVICVPNSDAYEGLTCLYSDGSAIAVCPHSTWDYPHDARGLVQHEAGGHGWGKLDDEYIYHRAIIQTCPCLCCSHVDEVQSMHALGWGRNLSLDGKYKNVPWTHLIFDQRYGDIVDIYEGGHMHSNGIYRSELNSCMNNNVPYFSTWSRQLIVERILWAAGEAFDFETFVSKDSREMGSKFLTRGVTEMPWRQVKAYHSDRHHPVIRKGRPRDYVRQGKMKIEN